MNSNHKIAEPGLWDMQIYKNLLLDQDLENKSCSKWYYKIVCKTGSEMFSQISQQELNECSILHEVANVLVSICLVAPNKSEQACQNYSEQNP